MAHASGDVLQRIGRRPDRWRGPRRADVRTAPLLGGCRRSRFRGGRRRREWTSEPVIGTPSPHGGPVSGGGGLSGEATDGLGLAGETSQAPACSTLAGACESQASGCLVCRSGTAGESPAGPESRSSGPAGCSTFQPRPGAVPGSRGGDRRRKDVAPRTPGGAGPRPGGSRPATSTTADPWHKDGTVLGGEAGVQRYLGDHAVCGHPGLTRGLIPGSRPARRAATPCP